MPPPMTATLNVWGCEETDVVVFGTEDIADMVCSRWWKFIVRVSWAG